MLRKSRYIAIIVLILGLISISFGIAFVVQGVAKDNMLRDEMRAEQVTYLLPEEEVAKGNVIDTAEEAEEVADAIREHRHDIAPTYEDLLDGGRYDPTNPEHLSYAQAMNMENYLYLAVMGFGLTTVVIVSGIFMIITGIALGGTGAVLFRLSKKAV